MKIKDRIKHGIGLNYLGHAYNDVFFFMIPLLMPLLKSEFGLTYAQSGLIITGHIGVRSIFSYVSGHIGDNYDKRIILAASFFISSVLLASLIWAGTITSVVLFFLLLGIGVSAFHPLATVMAGEEALPEYHAFHIGMFETAGALGLVIASLTFGIAVESVGWRMTCFFFALPGIPLAWAYLKMKQKRIEEAKEGKNTVAKSNIIIFIIGRGIRALGVGVLFSFLPTFGTDFVGLSAGGASWLTTIMFVGAVIGSGLSGWYSDKRNPLLLVWTSTALMVPLMVGITAFNSLTLIFLIALILGFLNAGFFTPQNSWLTTVSSASARGRVMGAAFLIDGFAVTISPTLFGWIADEMGLASSFRLAAIPIVISLFFFLYLYRRQHQGKLHQSSTIEI